MGGELLKGSPSDFSYTKQFYDYFPYYLSMGMTYDQYWNDDCLLTKYYRKADEMSLKKKNQEMWLQGMYFYDALCKVSPILHAFAKSGVEPVPYPSEPYSLTGEDIEAKKKAEQKRNRQRARIVFEIWAENWKPKE